MQAEIDPRGRMEDSSDCGVIEGETGVQSEAMTNDAGYERYECEKDKTRRAN